MQWFTNRKTAAKLLIGFGITLTLLAALGIFAISEMSAVEGHSSIIAEDWLPSTRTALEIKAAETDYRLNEYSHVLAVQAATMSQTEQQMAAIQKDLDGYFRQYQQTILSDADQTLLDSVRSVWDTYVAKHDRNMELSRSGDSRAEDSLRSREADFQAALTAADRLVQHNVDGGTAAGAAALATYKRDRTLIITVLLVSLLIGVVLAILIARTISRPLVEGVSVLQRVADGDFTAELRIDSADEVGQVAAALNRAVESVRAALVEVRMSAEATASSAQELQSASEEIASGAQEQASSLEETAASLEEMTASVKQNADSAQQASQLAEGARDVAEKGGSVVRDAVGAMNDITDASRRIADIITTIDEIAFQTNILALNAAVEAARAGQQGRGFAVVAGEVRKLAQRSASAAREIKGLIQDSTTKVAGGTELVQRSGTSLEEIVVSVKRVADIVGEMAAASREQASGIDQVNRAVVQMDSVTQANAGQTEELAGTAEGMAAQAEQLQALVGRFTVDADGHTAQRPKPRAKRAVAPRRNGNGAVAPRPASTNGHNGNRLAGALAGAGVGADELPDLDQFQEY